MRRACGLLAAAALLLASRGAAAAAGPETWPGKLQLGLKPLGTQIVFSSPYAGARFAVDFEGRVADLQKLSIWVGGEPSVMVGFFDPARNRVSDCCISIDFQIWLFVELSLEKLFQVPLVPFVRAGVGGGATSASTDGGTLFGRVSSGIYYYVTRGFGIGGELGLSLGTGIGEDAFHNTTFSFYGVWDAMLGMRFAF
jgi:hypothetical protein